MPPRPFVPASAGLAWASDQPLCRDGGAEIMSVGDKGPIIGWYVHHQGFGHAVRFVAVAEKMRVIAPEVRLVGLGSVPPRGWDGGWVGLARDDDPMPTDPDPTADGALHWAPLLHRGMQSRSATTAEWLRKSGCRLFVSDVSVEMLLLARLCSVPTVALAMRGVREDRPHALGYDVAEALLAPWPASTQEQLPPQWMKKLTAVGSFSRFDDLINDDAQDEQGGSVRTVLLLLGNGGHEVSFDAVAEAADATPDWNWRIAGVSAAEANVSTRENLTFLGYVENVWQELQESSVVVGPCGTGSVGEVAAARRPFIALPQERPFDEQLVQASILERAGLVDVIRQWPPSSEWDGLLTKAATRSGLEWTPYNDGRGAERACRFLLDLASKLHWEG